MNLFYFIFMWHTNVFKEPEIYNTNQVLELQKHGVDNKGLINIKPQKTHITSQLKMNSIYIF